uniref:DDE_Tnp_1_7 domain-containing protein n=1 Tax=Angiostrongylus cantonensis TaxID=6313 RepID=A0A0K0D6T4_ANGCA
MMLKLYNVKFYQERPITNRQIQEDSGPDPLEVDLIQLNDEINDLRMDEDDLIFEDFTRLRLKGTDSTDEPSPSVQPPSLI